MPTATGNINYDKSDSRSMIEEAYQILKDDQNIISIIENGYDSNETEDDNMQNIENRIDNYILNHPILQEAIINIYKKRDVTIPLYKSTEKNEVIDAKKRLIEEKLVK
jgi:hypothetical protein